MGFESQLPRNAAAGFALVLDNSVMMRWLFDDGSKSDRRYAAKVLDRLRELHGSVFAPYVWVYEAAYLVNFYVERGDMEKSAGLRHLASLHDLASVVCERQSPASLLEFAQAHGLSAYDSAYLLLARSLNLPIATLDRKMRRVASEVGIEIY